MQEFLDIGRQLMQADRVDRRDADRAADHLLHLLQLAQQLLVTVQQLLGGLVHPLSFPRELKLLLTAVDQERLEMPLHRPGLLAHRRLGDAVKFGRLRKTLRFDEVGKDFEIFDLHESF